MGAISAVGEHIYTAIFWGEKIGENGHFDASKNGG
jgi:hypothetical protein